MENFLFAIVLTIIIVYILVMRKLKSDVKQMEDVDFNLSVASYEPKIKPGSNKLIITSLGADYESTLKTINRYRETPLDAVKVGDQVVSSLNIYSAEDLLYELKYIGADGKIIEEDGHESD